MSSFIDILIAKNPLLAHGPRTHDTGIALTRPNSTGTVRSRRPRRDVDAPKIHLGHAGR